MGGRSVHDIGWQIDKGGKQIEGGQLREERIVKIQLQNLKFFLETEAYRINLGHNALVYSNLPYFRPL